LKVGKDLLLAERFEKVYISVHEFIHSWDKEIYELNNLDFFTFQLINELGYQIEHSYFKQRKRTPYLSIEPEDIGTLAFNLSDSLESFFENNCFGDCSLACPIKLNEPVSPEEREFANNHLQIIQMVYDIDWNKKHYMVSDILNYVVLDTLFDFYNYEIGLDLDDKDIGLIQFADFITDIIVKFIEKNGKTYLMKPHEPASTLFSLMLQETDEKWEEMSHFTFNDDDDESETWKQSKQSINQIQEAFLHDYEDPEKAQYVLTFFKRYLVDFLGINQIDEIIPEDIEEFLSLWLVREMALEQRLSFQEIWQILEHYFNWLELAFEVNLKDDYLFFKEINSAQIEYAAMASKRYLDNNQQIDGFIESCSDNQNIVNGFFEIVRLSPNGFLRIRDIHLKKEFVNVQLNFNFDLMRLQGFVFHGSLKPTAYGWRIIDLDYFYPSSVKPFVQ
jgi:hypothetical protein